MKDEHLLETVVHGFSKTKEQGRQKEKYICTGGINLQHTRVLVTPTNA